MKSKQKSWSLVPLETLAIPEKGSIRRGPFGGSLKKEIFVSKGYLVYEQQHVIENDFSLGRYFVNEAKYKEMEGFKVIPDDLIISCAGTIGKIAIVPSNARPGIINQALMRIRPDQNKVLPIYLKRYLESPIAQREIFSKAPGSALKNLAAISEIKKSKIPLPPLEEQKRIAAILDKADRIRRKRQEAIVLTEELARSLFLDMFGDPVTNPKGWEVRKLEDVTNKITDGVHAKPKYTETGIPFISVKDITTGKLIFDNCKFISEEAHLKYIKRCNPEFGDILYTKVGATYGRPALINVKNEFSIYVSVALLKPKRNIIRSEFLKEVMVTPAVKHQADKSIKGIGVPDLHLNMIRQFLIPVPDLDIQDKFLSKVRKINKQFLKQEKHLQESENLFNSLLQRAFRGDL